MLKMQIKNLNYRIFYNCFKKNNNKINYKKKKIKN